MKPDWNDFSFIVFRLGVVPLENTWMSSWENFFVERRLKDRLMVRERYLVFSVSQS